MTIDGGVATVWVGVATTIVGAAAIVVGCVWSSRAHSQGKTALEQGREALRQGQLALEAQRKAAEAAEEAATAANKANELASEANQLSASVLHENRTAQMPHVLVPIALDVGRDLQKRAVVLHLANAGKGAAADIAALCQGRYSDAPEVWEGVDCHALPPVLVGEERFRPSRQECIGDRPFGPAKWPRLLEVKVTISYRDPHGQRFKHEYSPPVQ